MTRYLRIKPSGEEEVITLPTLQDLQREVGGLIEHVHSPNLPRATVFVNEEGLIYDLPLNKKASAKLGINLVGTVLIAGPVDREGEIMDYEKLEVV